MIGVPPSGAGTDSIPAAADVEVAVGMSATEAFATVLTIDVADAEEREAEQRLVEAFSQGLITQLDTPDGLATLDQAVHSAGLMPIPGGSVRTDLLMTRDRLAAGAAIVEGRGPRCHQTTLNADTAAAAAAATVHSAEKSVGFLAERSFHRVLDIARSRRPGPTRRRPPRRRSPPFRWTSPRNRTPVPSTPSSPFRGATRSLRHGYDGRLSPDDTLACRVSGLEVTRLAGLLDGADLVAPLGNGALPPECDTLLQELAVDDYTYAGSAATFASSAAPACPWPRSPAAWAPSTRCATTPRSCRPAPAAPRPARHRGSGKTSARRVAPRRHGRQPRRHDPLDAGVDTDVPRMDDRAAGRRRRSTVGPSTTSTSNRPPGRATPAPPARSSSTRAAPC